MKRTISLLLILVLTLTTLTACGGRNSLHQNLQDSWVLLALDVYFEGERFEVVDDHMEFTENEWIQGNRLSQYSISENEEFIVVDNTTIRFTLDGNKLIIDGMTYFRAGSDELENHRSELLSRGEAEIARFVAWRTEAEQVLADYDAAIDAVAERLESELLSALQGTWVADFYNPNRNLSGTARWVFDSHGNGEYTENSVLVDRGWGFFGTEMVTKFDTTGNFSADQFRFPRDSFRYHRHRLVLLIDIVFDDDASTDLLNTLRDEIEWLNTADLTALLERIETVSISLAGTATEVANAYIDEVFTRTDTNERSGTGIQFSSELGINYFTSSGDRTFVRQN